MSAAAKHYDYSPTTVNAKLLKGWSPEQALGLKKRKGFHPESIGIVYIIQNKINKKIYIGASLGTLANRWKWHTEKSILKKRKIYSNVQDAIAKYDIVYASTARKRDINKKHLSFRDFIKSIKKNRKKKIGDLEKKKIEVNGNKQTKN